MQNPQISKALKIGELAQQTGLSIRTLHYYDEIGLLSPSQRTEAGHRLYNDEDISCLQQILSLRQLGFALKEIRACLANPDFSLPKIVDLHRAKIREEMALSRTLLKQLDAIATEIATTQTVAVENLIQVMETITMSQKYFTPEQQNLLEARFQEVETEWQDLVSQAQAKMRQGVDFSHPAVQWLANRWQAAMKSLIGGDAAIYRALAQVYQQAEVEDVSWGAMDNATLEYILKACAFSHLGQDIQLQLSETNYTQDAIAVIELGQAAIHQLNLDIFGTEGILLGLIAQKNSLAAQMLQNAGITLTQAQNEIIGQLGERSAPSIPLPPPGKMPFAYRTMRVLELARQEAQRLPKKQITPECLLWGILQETVEVEAENQPSGVASRVLREGFGINLTALEQQVKTAISRFSE